MQHYKNTKTGQVYGAGARTIPPVAFFEARPTEFTKTSKPTPKPKAPAKGDADDDSQTPKE